LFHHNLLFFLQSFHFSFVFSSLNFSHFIISLLFFILLSSSFSLVNIFSFIYFNPISYFSVYYILFFYPHFLIPSLSLVALIFSFSVVYNHYSIIIIGSILLAHFIITISLINCISSFL
jgi:hypothetical protein